MSDELKSQVDGLLKSNEQLAQQLNMANIEKNVLSQTVQEYLGANVRSRTHSILLENQVNILTQQLNAEKEKVVQLELKVKDLELKLNPPCGEEPPKE